MAVTPRLWQAFDVCARLAAARHVLGYLVLGPVPMSTKATHQVPYTDAGRVGESTPERSFPMRRGLSHNRHRLDGLGGG